MIGSISWHNTTELYQEIIEFLVKNGWNLNDSSAFFKAVSIINSFMLEALVNCKADINLTLDENANTLLHYVGRNGVYNYDWSRHEYLVKLGADVFALNSNGQKPDEVAVSSQNYETVHFLQIMQNSYLMKYAKMLL